MAYLPPDVITAGSFPTPGTTVDPSCDLRTLTKILKEKWARFFPLVDYYPLAYTPTTTTTPGGTSGKPGETVVDDLWGEDIPQQVTADWIQPHDLTAAGILEDATDTKKWRQSVKINLPIQRTLDSKTLKKMGIDNMRDGIITYLTAQLDTVDVTIKTGDMVMYDGEAYEVMEFKPNGFWLNTNWFLYMIGTVKRMRLGS